MKKPKASWAGNDNTSYSSILSCNQSEEPLNENEKSGRPTRRFKRYGSKDWKDSYIAEQTEKLEPRQEMIVERRIFEPTDLEQLLMSFLSLNSRVHHKAILKAFSDIWKEVFSGP
ncbi:transcription repressor OFP8-like [Salvia divinorum]|uniref:Transcription repressor n=1 Tax=Salvia divinorum TaxID=28513 RepID=A0ABD1FSN5_SALDI